jgi:SAP domain
MAVEGRDIPEEFPPDHPLRTNPYAVDEEGKPVGGREEAYKPPMPADALDLQARIDRTTKGPDVEREQKLMEEGSQPGGGDVSDVPQPGSVEGGQEGENADTGTGPYESRTDEQLQRLAQNRGLDTSGSRDDLIARLRA